MNSYVMSLGYDEKFAVRFLLRHSVKEGDVVLVIVPRGYEGDEKARVAVNNLKKLVEWAEIIEFDHKNPIREIPFLKSSIMERTSRSERIYLCLSGGMRIIVVSTLLAAQQLIGEVAKEVWIEIDLEDLSGTSTIPLNVFTIPRSERYLKILEVLVRAEKPTTRYVAKETPFSLSTVSREMRKMILLGLITNEYRVTEIGKAYLMVHGRL